MENARRWRRRKLCNVSLVDVTVRICIFQILSSPTQSCCEVTSLCAAACLPPGCTRRSAPALQVAGGYVAVFTPLASPADTHTYGHVVSDQTCSRPLNMNDCRIHCGSLSHSRLTSTRIMDPKAGPIQLRLRSRASMIEIYPELTNK